MRRRMLAPGIEVSELGLGTWGLSGDGYAPVPELEQDRVIDRALATGIRVFDTADSYARGAMEQRLGMRVPDDDKHWIITKIGTCRASEPPRKRFEREYLREAFERSRERLRRSVVSAVLLHNPSRDTLLHSDATAFLNELKESGQVRLWGVSVSTADTAGIAMQLGADLLALPYNAFYSAELSKMRVALGVRSIGILAHSVLAYGLLCGHWASDKEFAYDDHRRERWTSDEFRKRIRQLDALRPAVGDDILNMRAVALRYVLSNPHVSAAILGPRSSLQLDQLVREAGREPPYLSDEKRFALEARLHEVGVPT